MRPAAGTIPEDGTTDKMYPDEFLSAFLSSVKVFGYLEQPVFHEFAKHLQTRKLEAGELLRMAGSEQEKSFHIVIEGCVQVYVKRQSGENMSSGLDYNYTLSSSDDDELETDKTEEQRFLANHQLFNEVKAGGTLSSLFTILSLFTEGLDSWPNTTNILQSASSPSSALKNAVAFNISAQRESLVSPTSASETIAARLEKSAETSQYSDSVENDASEKLAQVVSSIKTADADTKPVAEAVPRPASAISAMQSPHGQVAAAASASAPEVRHRHIPEHLHIPGYTRLRTPYPQTPQTPGKLQSSAVFRATVPSTLAVIPADAFLQSLPKSIPGLLHI